MTRRRGNITDVPEEQLLFDKENPRLAAGAGGESQKDLLRVLCNEMSVDEVALSIAANGFFPEEQLLVIPDGGRAGKGDRYIVVEGNRRLAAVRLLRDASLREEMGATDLPCLSPAELKALDRLPVSIYGNREELWEFFGFRHINGPKPWDAFSKAKYVADVKEQYHVPLDEIARRIGDRHATVKRLYRGFKILEQAQAEGIFSREDAFKRRFYFSHLYTAADQPEFQRFLGITPEDSLRRNPVPRAKGRELRDLMSWLYGSRSTDSPPLVRSQNPDLNTLREVISGPRGLAALRAGFSLERAHEISIGDDRRFREALVRAKEDLQQAKATVTTGFSGEPDLRQVIDDILQVGTTIRSEMQNYVQGRKRPRSR
jgi:hypothetical protein